MHPIGYGMARFDGDFLEAGCGQTVLVFGKRQSPCDAPDPAPSFHAFLRAQLVFGHYVGDAEPPPPAGGP